MNCMFVKISAVCYYSFRSRVLLVKLLRDVAVRLWSVNITQDAVKDVYAVKQET